MSYPQGVNWVHLCYNTAMHKKVLSEIQIQEAKSLMYAGFTKRELAKKYNVGSTTIWENIFSTGKRKRTKPKRKWVKRTLKDLQFVREMVWEYKRLDYTSKQVSDILNAPLEDINKIYLLTQSKKNG